MKKFLFALIILCLSLHAGAQASRFTVDFDGIGEIKLGMSLPELEKLLGKKIVLKVIDIDPVVLVETIPARYKNIPVELSLIKRFGESSTYVILDGIRTESPLCKTAAGLGLGSPKMKIVDHYEANPLVIGPDVIIVSSDELQHVLEFTLKNDKVAAVEVRYHYIN